MSTIHAGEVAATKLPYDAGPGITFAQQDSLPKLPIADLQDTCRNYLSAVKPLQTPREHADTVAAVKRFLKTDGPELQERLKKYASSKSSYIEQFCTSGNLVPGHHRKKKLTE